MEDFDAADFFKKVSEAKKRALLLDYDGTLAPFCVKRDEAYPYPGVREILSDILDVQNTRLVIVSGRPVDDVVKLLGLKQNLEIWGSHGSERLKPDGVYELLKPDDETLERFFEVDVWLKLKGMEHLLEKKITSRAVHLRGVEEAEANAIKERLMKSWSKLAEESGLEAHEFDGGVELRASGRDKGHAVDTILDEMGDEALTVYLGDDLTDEDAFKAIKGRGVSFLVRTEMRETSADHRLKPPEELLKFLSDWIRACGGEI